jgi:hypothetical protein
VTDLATLRSACSQTGIEVIASLAQHRILSTAQVRAIHLPDRSYRWAQKLLARLDEAGLAGYIETPHGRRAASGTSPSAAPAWRERLASWTASRA